MPRRFKKVYIEISNVCNLQCSFCPEVERGKRFMDPTLFEKVITAIGPLTEEVCFHLMGEPLLHPQLSGYLDFCAVHQVPVNLTTNGILLDEKRRDQLLAAPALKQVNFSLQSFDSNFPGQDNTAYLEKIFDFTRRALTQRPALYINYRFWNVGDSPSESGNPKLFDQIRQALQVDFNPALDVRRKKSAPIMGRVSLHLDSRFEWPNPHHPIRSEKGFCYGLTSHIGILADGTVVPCCLDKEGVINLGNCGRQSIDDIINSTRARTMRNGFHKGILVEDLCRKCTFIARFDQKVHNPAHGKKWTNQKTISDSPAAETAL